MNGYFKQKTVKQCLCQILIFFIYECKTDSFIMSVDNVSSPALAKQMSLNMTTSSQTKPHKAAQWEIDTIFDFLLELYHVLYFGVRTEWKVPKSIMRSKFRDYLKQNKIEPSLRQRLLDANGTLDIGTLLHRTNFLLNMQRGSDFYLIRSASFFQNFNKLMEKLDEKRKNGETKFLPSSGEDKSPINGDPALIDSLHVDENAPIHELLYEGSQEQERTKGFQLTNMGCYICQMNFVSPCSFEDHVEDHGDESDFNLLKNYVKKSSPIFKLSYNICQNSHYFRFNLISSRRNIIIEKLVIVQSRNFYYVHNIRVPYALDEDGKDNFFVDSHLFRKGVVQPIVVVFYEQSNKEKRFVEQHHFCRVEEFPAVKLSINPCRLPNKIKFTPKFKLPQYMPPDEIRKLLQTELIESPLCDVYKEFKDFLNNNKTLTQENIRTVLSTLIQIEDWDTMREYSSLVQRNAKLRQYDNEYIIKLKIPKNIRFENIIFPYDDVILLPTDEANNILPNKLDDLVNKMDQLIIDSSDKQKEAKKKKCYNGQIKSISYGRVTFACDQKIPEEKTFTVLFRPSRMVIRYQYRALEQLVAMPKNVVKKFLFPEEVMMRELSPIRLELRNTNIYKNPEQYQAIQCIVNNSVEKMAPYILFGPPGTGKTTTLVEAILQIYTLQPHSRILITAGSNGACDEIALRLCNLLSPINEKKILTRIYSRSYENRSENINELLLEYSNLYADHFLPSINVLHEYRIVVCTLSIIGRLSTGKFGKEIDGSGVFTHVFVDEVAASTEAETLVGIMATLSSEANLIISGDHRQLGPILNSRRAADLGLELSLMERLLKRDCYRVNEHGNYNQQIQTRLCRNYRSHPEIVKLYSEMFYKGSLIAEADTDVKTLCRDWHRAPNINYPIIFHSIFGPEQRDPNSTSRYNPLEITTVLDYVRDLLYFGIKGKNIAQSDIGIITPYKKQYMRIQDELNLRNWYQIECGSVETFQGKEKNIIIVSFVRSFTNNLGFLDSKKRLNVTLSRARSLLVLIGNPRTLSINDDFKHIIEQCREHKTLVGAGYYDGGNGDNNGEQPNANKNNKRRKGGRKKQAGGGVGAAAKDITSDADDFLKSKNASTFKTVKPQSAEKQREKYEIYKDLCRRQTISANANINNSKNGIDVNQLLNDLPRVPQQRSQLQQQQQQQLQQSALHIHERHFEISKSTPNKNETNTTSMHATRVTKTPIAATRSIINVASTNNTTTVTTAYSLSGAALRAANRIQIQPEINMTPTNTAPIRQSFINNSSGAAPNKNETNKTSMHATSVTKTRIINVASTNNTTTVTTAYSLSGAALRAANRIQIQPEINMTPTNTAPIRQPLINNSSGTVFGTTEYPSTPIYVRPMKTEAPPPKPKTSKSKCIIA